MGREADKTIYILHQYDKLHQFHILVSAKNECLIFLSQGDVLSEHSTLAAAFLLPRFNSQPCKAEQRVSLTTYCPWATCY